MCAAGHRVVLDFDSNNNDVSHAENKLTGEKTYFSAKSRVGTRSQSHPEDGNGRGRRVVPFRCAHSLSARPSESAAEPGLDRVDEEQEGQSVMAESDHDPACEPGAVRARAVPIGPTRQKKEDHEVAGHVPYRSWCRACVAGRGRSDAHLTHRTSTSTTTGIDPGYLEDRVTLGQQEARPSPILVTTSTTAQVTTPEVPPYKGTAHPRCVQSLVRATVGTGDVQIILQSDNEPAILHLERQAAAECRVRRGMTVIIDDTTEHDSQNNRPAELAVREVKGVARSIRVALGGLYKKHISSKHLVLTWLVSYAQVKSRVGRSEPAKAPFFLKQQCVRSPCNTGSPGGEKQTRKLTDDKDRYYTCSQLRC